MDNGPIDAIPLAPLVMFQGLLETPESLQDRSKIKCNFRILGRKFGRHLEVMEREIGS